MFGMNPEKILTILASGMTPSQKEQLIEAAQTVRDKAASTESLLAGLVEKNEEIQRQIDEVKAMLWSLAGAETEEAEQLNAIESQVLGTGELVEELAEITPGTEPEVSDNGNG